jgi:hypothetical protein
MLNNPLIQRYRASIMGASSLLIYTVLYLIAVVLIILGNVAVVDIKSPGVLRDVASRVFCFLAILQSIFLWGWASYNSAQAIRMEYERKSYDFFRMLPLTANEKAVGVLVGSNLIVLLLALINACLMILFAANQYINIQLQLVIWSGAFALSSASLLSSSSPQKIKSKRKSASSGISVIGVIMLYFMVVGVVSNTDCIATSDLFAKSVPFGPLHIPLFMAFVVVALTVGGWSYIGVLRRFTVEDMPLFTRKGSVVFMANIMGILMMFVYPHINKDNYSLVLGIVMVVGLVLAVLTLAGALNLAVHYMEIVRRSGDTAVTAIRRRLKHISNFHTALWLFGIQCFAIAIVVMPYSDAGIVKQLPPILGMVVTYIFIVLIAEIYSLYAGTNRLVGLIISFAMILYVVLPLILAALLNYGDLAFVSGVNYMIGNLTGDCDIELIAVPSMILLVFNGLLFAYMYWLIRKQAETLAAFAATIT